MDPTIPRRPKHWRTYGKLGLFLLIAAVLTAAGGRLASTWGRDPSITYRFAALFSAGAMMFGLIWAGSRGTRTPSDGHTG